MNLLIFPCKNILKIFKKFNNKSKVKNKKKSVGDAFRTPSKSLVAGSYDAYPQDANLTLVGEIYFP